MGDLLELQNGASDGKLESLDVEPLAMDLIAAAGLSPRNIQSPDSWNPEAHPERPEGAEQSPQGKPTHRRVVSCTASPVTGGTPWWRQTFPSVTWHACTTP